MPVTGQVRRADLRAWVGRVLRRPVIELVGLAVGYGLFSWLHNLAGTDVASATANAHALQGLEASVHLNVEGTANHWLAQHATLAQSAVVIYRLYYLPLAGVLLWVLFRHAELYPTVRRTLIVMASVALLVFWLFPVSPPRFALAGIVDVVTRHDPFSGGATREMPNGQNLYSAMPSLHVGWSALCAYAAWLALRGQHPRSALLVWLFPVIMIGVVITTGAHYVVDVIGSAVLLTVSMAFATGWERWRLAERARLDLRVPPLR